MKRINLNRPDLIHDEDDPDGYNAGYDRFGPKIGATQMGATIYELPPGQSICPYHYEYPEEEWLIVLQGRPILRHPEGEDELEPGDVVCFPTGAEGAHKVTNKAADAAARVMMLSTQSPSSIAVYPDSDKIGIFPPDKRDKVMVRRESGVDYWDRET
jgi:uncharacterized cupin superfamily protein